MLGVIFAYNPYYRFAYVTVTFLSFFVIPILIIPGLHECLLEYFLTLASFSVCRPGVCMKISVIDMGQFQIYPDFLISCFWGVGLGKLHVPIVPLEVYVPKGRWKWSVPPKS